MTKGRIILIMTVVIILTGLGRLGATLYQAFPMGGKVLGLPQLAAQEGSHTFFPTQGEGKGLDLSRQEGTDRVSLKIEGQGKMKGMVCMGCANSVKNALLTVPGVLAAEVDLAENRAEVECEQGKVALEQLQSAVEKAGFHAVPLGQ